MILYLYNIDTLNICMKEFIIIVCTDSSEIFFSKLRPAGLNYNLLSFFNDSYCAGGGVSNKHCLLTFFILPVSGKICHLPIKKVKRQPTLIISFSQHSPFFERQSKNLGRNPTGVIHYLGS